MGDVENYLRNIKGTSDNELYKLFSAPLQVVTFLIELYSELLAYTPAGTNEFD
jgi:hypothetical protein